MTQKFGLGRETAPETDSWTSILFDWYQSNAIHIIDFLAKKSEARGVGTTEKPRLFSPDKVSFLIAWTEHTYTHTQIHSLSLSNTHIHNKLTHINTHTHMYGGCASVC